MIDANIQNLYKWLLKDKDTVLASNIRDDGTVYIVIRTKLGNCIPMDLLPTDVTLASDLPTFNTYRINNSI
jgi:hypothetical protein